MARKKVRKKVKKLISEFHKKFPLEYDGLNAGDEVVYVRLSDGKTSLGIIKYFHPGETTCATVIDISLGNYQTAIVDDIVREPTQKIMKSLSDKIPSRKGRRR